MGKNRKTKHRDRPAVAELDKVAQPLEKISFQDIQNEVLSDDDEEEQSELPPEHEWDDKTKALKQAIMDGKFDHLLRKSEANTGDDEESLEEVVLDDNSQDELDSVATDQSSDPVAEKLGESQVGHRDDEEDETRQNEERDSEFEKKQADLDVQSEDDIEDDDDDDAALQTPVQRNARSLRALQIATEELISAHSVLPWAETFDIVSEQALPFIDDDGKPKKLSTEKYGLGDVDATPMLTFSVHDDLKREVAFYDMALAAAQEAHRKCVEANITFSRPDDFFAEMVKTDGKFQTCQCSQISIDAIMNSLHKF
jgi:rRNA-processing protein EBP2